MAGAVNFLYSFPYNHGLIRGAPTGVTFVSALIDINTDTLIQFIPTSPLGVWGGGRGGRATWAPQWGLYSGAMPHPLKCWLLSNINVRPWSQVHSLNFKAFYCDLFLSDQTLQNNNEEYRLCQQSPYSIGPILPTPMRNIFYWFCTHPWLVPVWKGDRLRVMPFLKFLEENHDILSNRW